MTYDMCSWEVPVAPARLFAHQTEWDFRSDRE